MHVCSFKCVPKYSIFFSDYKRCVFSSCTLLIHRNVIGFDVLSYIFRFSLTGSLGLRTIIHIQVLTDWILGSKSVFVDSSDFIFYKGNNSI